MSIFGITAVRLDQDGWVDTAVIGEISRDRVDFVQGTMTECKASDIAKMIKGGDEVYCVFGRVDELGPRFDIADLKHRGEGIKLVDDLPNRGLQQLIQLENALQGQQNPLGSW